MKIALGAAKGLAFLHEAEKPVIYRDFKASNILLDSTRPSREQNLAEWARALLKSPRKLGRVMDPRLEGQYSEAGAQKAAALAYQCLSHRPKLRPMMSEVIEVLEPLQDSDGNQIGTFVFVSTDSDSREISSNGEKLKETKRENHRKPAAKSPKSPLTFTEMNSSHHHRMRRV
ncbi:hypothetical protein SASPL_109732 [Salvia splendens]|uniref:Protein kinase domain-containing protein n=1 Tax=Salvia splendens TaxID=180675 RepID=A0A8X8YH09_SALSN|nr:hypothetical protein SASPL_109732 [Salvia splendens]